MGILRSGLGTQLTDNTIRRAWFAIPGDPETLTGGYAYARRLTTALADRGCQLDVVNLPASFPLSTPKDHDIACKTLNTLGEDRPVLVDGLAFGALDAHFLANAPHHWVALIHHPLSLESGLDGATLSRLRQTEKAALATASAVIVTSPATARCLVADYEVPEHRIAVVPPGTERAARSSGKGVVPTLLSVATLTPRKGYDDLVQAYACMTNLDWTATWVGSLTRDPATANAVRQAVVDHALADRITFAGEVTADTLEEIYRTADIFVLASRHEGYGMAFAEALAHGLPVIGCAVGALPETVPANAGLLVPTDNPDALAAAVKRLLTDTSERRAMAEAAWQYGNTLPTWEQAAAQAEAVLAAAMMA